MLRRQVAGMYLHQSCFCRMLWFAGVFSPFGCLAAHDAFTTSKGIANGRVPSTLTRSDVRWQKTTGSEHIYLFTLYKPHNVVNEESMSIRTEPRSTGG